MHAYSGAEFNAFAGLFLALALTLVVELPVAFLFGLRDRRSLAIVCLMNAVTNPLLNYFLLVAGIIAPGSFGIPSLFFLEAFVVFAEWKLLSHAFPARRGLFGLSLAMNAASFLAGVLFFGF